MWIGRGAAAILLGDVSRGNETSETLDRSCVHSVNGIRCRVMWVALMLHICVSCVVST